MTTDQPNNKSCSLPLTNTHLYLPCFVIDCSTQFSHSQLAWLRRKWWGFQLCSFPIYFSCQRAAPAVVPLKRLSAVPPLGNSRDSWSVWAHFVTLGWISSTGWTLWGSGHCQMKDGGRDLWMNGVENNGLSNVLCCHRWLVRLGVYLHLQTSLFVRTCWKCMHRFT